MTKTKKIFLILSFFLVFILLFFSVWFLFKLNNAKKAEVSNSNIGMYTGSIENVSDGYISLKTVDLSKKDEEELIKKVVLNNKTEYYKVTSEIKDDAIFEKEQDDFNAKIKNISNAEIVKAGLEAPLRNKIIEIGKNDLNKGDYVRIYFDNSSDEKIAVKVVVELKQQYSNDFIYEGVELEYSGKFKKIEDNTIVVGELGVGPVSNNEEIFFFDGETIFLEKIEKSDEDFAKEQEVFNNGNKDDDVSRKAPERYSVKKVEVGDLQEGMLLELSYLLNNGNKKALEVTFVR